MRCDTFLIFRMSVYNTYPKKTVLANCALITSKVSSKKIFHMSIMISLTTELIEVSISRKLLIGHEQRFIRKKIIIGMVYIFKPRFSCSLIK